jgi:hypothetical protein
MLYEEKECKISKKQKTYKAFREKLDVSIFPPYINVWMASIFHYFKVIVMFLILAMMYSHYSAFFFPFLCGPFKKNVQLQACEKALNLRWKKFLRNASLLKRQLTWQYELHCFQYSHIL